METSITVFERVGGITSNLRNLLQKVLMRKDDELLTKQDVMGLLDISDTTYGRYVKMALLKPMRMHRIDMYRKEDLWTELEEPMQGKAINRE